MRAFLVRLPSGQRYWTVLDEDLQVVAVADDFLRHQRFGRDGAESTTKAYAHAIALFLRWCAWTGRDWLAGVERLGLFMTWLAHAGPVASKPKVIFHTDRGSQYLSQAFAEVAAQLDVRHSVGRVGSCFDNAQAESFNATLKVERVNRTVYPTREHARKDVTRYIEFRYNTKRLHSALGYRTPREAHADYQNQRSTA